MRNACAGVEPIRTPRENIGLANGFPVQEYPIIDFSTSLFLPSSSNYAFFFFLLPSSSFVSIEKKTNGGKKKKKRRSETRVEGEGVRGGREMKGRGRRKERERKRERIEGEAHKKIF